MQHIRHPALTRERARAGAPFDPGAMATPASKQAGAQRLSADNCAVLLVDHQAGLVQLVRDYDEHTFRNNVLALADVACAYGLPAVLTTSTEDGANGPLVPEIRAALPDAPYIARPGQINAWDNDDFVAAVKARAALAGRPESLRGVC